MRNRTEIETAISTINHKISELEVQLEELNEERSDLEQELHQAIIAERTTETLRLIHEVSNENAMRVRLYEDTRTTPIMDEFVSSGKEFLVFENAYTLSKCGKRVSLVIVKSKQKVNCSDNGLTMTDLKKSVGVYVSENSLNYLGETARKYPLFRELVSVDLKAPKTGDTVAFTAPCLLGGQTFKDQTGFGSEYCGDELVYQGKNYGETTKFLIIGLIIEKSALE